MTLNALRARSSGHYREVIDSLFSIFIRNEGGAEKKKKKQNISRRSQQPNGKAEKVFDFSVFRFAAGNGNSCRERSGCCCAVLYYRGQMRAARKMSSAGFNRKCCSRFIGLHERL